MFLCLVLTGESSDKGGGRGVKKPPFMDHRPGESYDSINNGAGGHFIVYDNVKSYPGYLITYM
jgi:hypothetical protein